MTSTVQQWLKAIADGNTGMEKKDLDTYACHYAEKAMQVSVKHNRQEMVDVIFSYFSMHHMQEPHLEGRC